MENIYRKIDSPRFSPSSKFTDIIHGYDTYLVFLEEIAVTIITN